MKYIEYKERLVHGTFNFPIGLYHQTPRSPRYTMTHHWHREFEVMHIISGAFHLTINDTTTTYHAGDVIFINSGFIHGGTPEDGCIYDCVVFDMRILLKENHACNKTLNDIQNRKILVNTLLSQGCDYIAPVMDKLTMAMAGRAVGYEFMVQAALNELFGYILYYKLYQEPDSNSAEIERLDSIKEVLAYISENYANNIALDDLARIAGMNPKYFCRYFRSMTERTPIDYLNYYRIECACEMLSTRDITIKEAAISCGFNDESYFIKTFHKYKGITPKQFMKAEF